MSIRQSLNGPTYRHRFRTSYSNRIDVEIDRLPCIAHPCFQSLPPPVIVIGMHRSGTSLVAAMLAKLGVYMGAQAILPEAMSPIGTPLARLFNNGYGEAAEFMLVNDRLLELAGGTWNSADAFLAAGSNLRFAQNCVRQIQRATHGILRRSYLRQYPASHTAAWGWKDPRTSLTLAYWLRAFPNAKVLHIRRTPEASAASLHRRAVAWSQSAPSPARLEDRLRHWTTFPDRLLLRAAQKLGLAPQPRTGPDPCLDLDYCRRLTKTYTDECLRVRHQGGKWQEVWYEDILAQPLQAAHNLAEFVEADHAENRLQAVAALVQPRGDLPLARY